MMSSVQIWRMKIATGTCYEGIRAAIIPRNSSPLPDCFLRAQINYSICRKTWLIAINLTGIYSTYIICRLNAWLLVTGRIYTYRQIIPTTRYQRYCKIPACRHRNNGIFSFLSLDVDTPSMQTMLACLSAGKRTAASRCGCVGRGGCRILPGVGAQ